MKIATNKRSGRSESELKALAYFVVGVSSEGTVRGRDVSNRLSFAGTVINGKMDPVENSGFTIGTLQKDLGQDGGATAGALVNAYQAWARAEQPDYILSAKQQSTTISDLSRNGNTIDKQKGRPLDATIKSRLDLFLKTEDGNDFVRARDVAQVNRIYEKALVPLGGTPAYVAASLDDRITLATIVAKGFNQNEGKVLTLLGKMNGQSKGGATLKTADEVLAYSQENFKGSMLEGRDAALRGAEVYARLHRAAPDHPLYDAWSDVVSDPLMSPSVISQDEDLAAHHRVIKNLFLEPGKSPRFLDALEHGSDYARGLPLSGAHRPSAGFLASGTDFVQWNAEGQGISHIDGVWAALSRDELSHTKNADGSIDLAVSQGGKPSPLLQVEAISPLPTRTDALRVLRHGNRGEDVRALQADLIRLNVMDASGRPLAADGDFGAGTQSAVKEFQRSHNLTEDGVVGPATLAAIHDFAGSQEHAIGQRDAPYLGGHRSHGTMSAYGSLTPEPAATVPLAPVPAKPSEPVAPAWLQAFDEADGHAIRTLQENLNTLGILDMKGESLAESGIYDVATQTAVARFQSQQSLPVTGTTDDDTLASIQGQAFVAELQQSDRASTFREPPATPETWRLTAELPPQAQPKEPEVAHVTRPQDSVLVPPRLDHPAHPDHEFFREVRKHVVELDRSLGRGPDHYTDNISSALTVQARTDGLERVDRIELSERGDVLRAVQMPSGNSGSQFGIRTQVATVEAETPLEQSAAKWPDAMRSFEGIEQARAERRQHSPGREQVGHVGISDGFGEPDRQTHSLHDPRNPDSRHHALYKELERRLPESSDERLMQFTAACHRHRIKANDLSGIHVNYDNMTLNLDSVGFMATPAKVDLSLPPPESEQSLQQMRQFDQQMEQIMQQSQQHAQAIQGPVMGGG